MGEIAAAVAANAAGSALGGMMGGSSNQLQNTLDSNSQYVNGTISNMNNILNTALNNAITSNNQGTSSAIGAQNQYLQQALQGSANASQVGLDQSRALSGPYNLAGLNATDQYLDSLGVARPTMGNAALQGALFNAQNAKPLLDAYNSAASAYGIAPGQQAQAPTMGNTNFQQPAWNLGMESAWSQQNAANDPEQQRQLKAMYDIKAQQQAQAQMNAAQAQYGQQQSLFNNVNTTQQALQNSGLTAQQLQVANAYNGGLFGTPVRRNV